MPETDVVTICWDIKTIDRLSTVKDILKESSCCGINIILMRVTPGRILIKSWRHQLQGISYAQSCLSQRADIIHVAYLYEEMSKLSTPEPKRPRYSSDIIYSSQSMYALIEKAIRISDSKYTVLIRGDTGTGKELLARVIHNSGQRRFYPLIPVNCSTLSESLMEGEFLGCKKGAFSGANRKGKGGLFEMADKGTLFLDEFGEISPSLQAKLLRMFQDGRIRRVGRVQIIPVNVRTIVATSANLGGIVEQRLLCAGLYYCINVLPLTIPPLHECPQSVSLLICHFVQKHAEEFQRWIILDKVCFNALYHYTWPGNMRGLENIIIRLMLTVESDVITREELRMVNLPAVEWDPTERPLKEQIPYAERQPIGQIMEDDMSSRHIAKALGVSHTTALNKTCGYQLESVS